MEDHRAEWLRPPTAEELQIVLETYAAQGMTGACGSVDCTRIHIPKTTVSHHNVNTGKSGRPEGSFEAIVGPDRLFHACTTLRHGANNDKAVAVTDSYVVKIRDGDFFPEATYLLRDKRGTEFLMKGAQLNARALMLDRPLALV